jgi:hypothetical protein
MSKSKNKPTLELGNKAKKSNPDYNEYINKKEDEYQNGFISRNGYSNGYKGTLKD